MLFHVLYYFFQIFLASAEHRVDFEIASNSSLMWGPYRSNLYVGVRPKIPDSLVTGLFWFSANDYTSVLQSKHSCEQSDDFEKFGWENFDPRFGGREIIKDKENHVDLTFDFVKSYNLKSVNDQSWGIKVKGTPKDGYDNARTAMVFYAGLEMIDPSTSQSLVITSVNKKKSGYGHDEIIELTGYSKDFQNFKIRINDGPGTNTHPKVAQNVLIDERFDPGYTKHCELNVPENNIWKAKEIFINLLQQTLTYLSDEFSKIDIKLDDVHPAMALTLPNINNYKGNLHYVEKIFKGPFEFDIIFTTENTDKPMARALGYEEITFGNIDEKINKTLEHFDKKFDEVFDFQSPFNESKYVTFGKDFISNLLGGIGYFHGDHLVDRITELDEEDATDGKFIKLVGKPEGPYELFTSVPSRPFFPRGFYWDEGFHLIPILEYDFDIALKILKSWFDLIDEDGWIAREQILGDEARSKVPDDFIVQNPNIANPPTLMLVFLDIIKKVDNEHQKVKNVNIDIDAPQIVQDFGSFADKSEISTSNVDKLFLDHPELMLDYGKSIYPKLQKHFEWFRNSQKGELDEFERTPYSRKEAYRWVGRTEKLCLPSGLDDYPRASYPDVGELHVDVISWVGSFARSMKELAELLGYEKDSEKYSKIENDIIHNIDDLHWSEDDKAYCDVTLDANDEDAFVCHKGYISLFPFLLKLVPHDSGRLIDILNLIYDPEELFSDYGIRSLSKKDEFFRTGEDYWRGKIWVNINYLVLESLIYYSQEKDGVSMNPEAQKVAKDLYKDLRIKLVNNIYKQWSKTGYGYENYDEKDGSPTGVRHFLGWTSLAVMIMKMPESI